MPPKKEIWSCSAENCSLRFACDRFRIYRERKNNGESLAMSLIPTERDGKCNNFLQTKYYGD